MDQREQPFHRPNSVGNTFLRTFLSSLVLLLVALPAPGLAQVTAITPTSGTGNLGTTVTPAGNLYNITGGTRPGNGPNLFHSFEMFSVGTADTAKFDNTTPALTTTNILSRVTGGQPSNIFGTIDTLSYTGANLFLINPAGIVFGPTASLNVSGSVSFTTADYIRLFDGTINGYLYADPARPSVLTSAPVAAFGFLNSSPASITVDGAFLSVPVGQTISLVGGDITISGSALSAPSGQISLVSVASAGEVLYPSLQLGPNVNGDSFSALGTISLSNGATLDVSSNFDPITGAVSGSGVVVIRGGQLTIDQSSIVANNFADSDGVNPGIDIQVSQDVILTQGASITSSTSGAGRGGDVQITAGKLSLDAFGTAITTQTFGAGHGGDVRITAGTLEMDNGAGIITDTEFGGGVGGDLFLNVGMLTLMGGSGILSTNLNFCGDLCANVRLGGNVKVQVIQEGSATGSMAISSGSQVLSTTFADGDGGQVSIAATSLTMNEAATINASTSGTGRGGDIVVSVHELSMSGGANIKSESLGDVGVGGTVTVQGLDGPESKANSVILSGQNSGIISDTLGIGQPGDIAVHAETLSLTSGAVIVAGTSIDAGPGAGNVTVDAVSVVISGGSSISSQSFAQDARDVTISATNALTMDNGSIITKTSSAGHGGDVVLNVGNLSLSGGAQINSSTAGSGRAGDITMNVGTINLTGNSTISSSSTGSATGAAGSITIQGLASPADTVSLTNSTIATSAESMGRGGSVSVDATNLMLNNGTISASVKDFGSAPDGASVGLGNIALTASTMNMSDGTITAATTGTRNAGTVTLNASSLNINTGTITTSTSGSGNAGSIMITTTGNTVSLSNGGRISSASTGTMANAGDAGSVSIVDSGSFTSDASTVATSAEHAKGGDISISAQSVQLSNGTSITASSNAPFVSDGSGNAGNIAITSGSTFVMQNSSVTTEASQASGGQITINAPEMVHLINSQIATSVAGAEADTAGGNISIDPQFVILQNSQILAQAFAGTGGNITITAGVFLADPNSLVDASSALGINGSVDIQAPVQNLSGTLVPLQQSYLETAGLLAQRCAARYADGQFSTFVLSARDGLPPGPGGLLPISTYVRAPGAGPKASAMALSSQPGGESLEVSVLSKDCNR